MSGTVVRVAISDPLPLFQAGVAGALEAGGYQVDALANVRSWAEDGVGIVVISLVDPDRWALMGDLGRESPTLPVVALLDEVSAASGTRAVMAGASAVLSRSVPVTRLVDACGAVLNGESVLPTVVLRQLRRNARHWQEAPPPPARELEWLRLLARGLTVGQLADRAGYSERMMFRLLRDLYNQLGVGSRSEAVLLAHERGWV